jgi:hypothetical protein
LKRGKSSPPTELIIQPDGPTSLELQEVELPVFDPEQAETVEATELDSQVIEQLHSYILAITRLYNANPFHC